MLSDTDVDDHYSPSVRLVEIERNGSNCGFQLTRSKYDPYPWISSVDPGSAASAAQMKPGDCVLEVNGEDIVGQRVSEVAEIVKSKPEQVSLLLWNAGVDPGCSPEALCCGPMPTNLQRLSACMSTILAFLECPVCLDTIPPPTYQCENGHLICIRCRTKSERCPVCRLRFNRSRSLLADQVYNALVDAFNLRGGPGNTRTAKIQEIFKLKNKNVPDIKVTQSHTNKFLARLVGKSTSVDNLAQTKFISGNNEFANNMKIKSLSNQDICEASPMVSRAGSITRLGRETKNLTPDNRPASYHGSYESLQRKIDEDGFSFVINPTEDSLLFHCPFSHDCPELIKGKSIIEHFQASHEGPLTHYFKSHVRMHLNKLFEQKGVCYLIQIEGKVFFLKWELIQTAIPSSENILLWLWFMGDKREANDYEMHVQVMNPENDHIIISVRNSVSSLSSTSHMDIRERKEGVLLNTATIGNLHEKINAVIDVNILKRDRN